MKPYYFLSQGERYKVGDEYLCTASKSWKRLTTGGEIKNSHTIVRRKVHSLKSIFNPVIRKKLKRKVTLRGTVLHS